MDSMSGVKSGGYTVTKVADQCAKDCCGPMCTKAECNQLCIHMYTCDKACYDLTIGTFANTFIVYTHSITQTRISTTTTEHTTRLLVRSYLWKKVMTLDPLEYAESIIPPQQDTHTTTLYMTLICTCILIL